MEEIVKHINDTNASFRQPNAGDAKNTDLFLDNEHYFLFKDCGEQITVRYSKEKSDQKQYCSLHLFCRENLTNLLHTNWSSSQKNLFLIN